MSGREIKKLMRLYGVTIRALSKKMNITMKRVRDRAMGMEEAP